MNSSLKCFQKSENPAQSNNFDVRKKEEKKKRKADKRRSEQVQ